MLKQVQNVLNDLLYLEFYVVFVLVVIGIFRGRESLLIAIFIGLSFWLIRWLAKGYLTLRTPSDFGILVLLIMTVFTLVVTSLEEVTEIQVYRLWSGIILFYAIINWTLTYRRLIILIIVFALLAFAFAVMSLFAVNWDYEKLSFIPSSIYHYFPQFFSDTVHHNVSAGYLVLLLPPLLGILLFSWKQINIYFKLLLIPVSVLTTSVLILTQSWGALLAFAIVFTLLLALCWRWVWLFALFGVVATAGLAYYIGVHRLLTILSSGVSLGGLEGRIEVWSRAIYMIQDFPVGGVGMGRFMRVADTMYPFFLAEPGSIPHAHNILLQIAVDLGIPGLIGWLSILIGIMVIAWRVYRQGGDYKKQWFAGLGAGLFLSQIALFIHGMVDAVTWGVIRLTPIVWMVWGLVVASYFVINKDNMSKKHKGFNS